MEAQRERNKLILKRPFTLISANPAASILGTQMCEQSPILQGHGGFSQLAIN